MSNIAYGTITITDTYDGVGLSESIPYYLASPLSSGVTIDTEGWSREVPALTSTNKYLWVYYVNRYGEGASEPEMIEVYGNVASFNYDGEVAPLEKCVVMIEPEQAGSGDPSPTNIRPISGWTGCEVTRTGKNLFNKNISLIPRKLINANGDIVDHTGYCYCDYIKVKPNTAYAFSGVYVGSTYQSVAFYDKEKTFISRYMPNRTEIQAQFTTPSTCQYIRVNFAMINYDDPSRLDTVQLEEGSVASEYEAFGITIPVNWESDAGTIYGGTLDVVRGKLAVTMTMISVADLSWTYYASGNYFYAIIPSRFLNAQDGTGISDSYAFYGTLASRDVSEMPDGYFMFPNNASKKYIYVKDSRYTTAEDFKSAMSTASFLYTVETPTSYDLTPTQIATLTGTNNVWADTGNIDVGYYDHQTVTTPYVIGVYGDPGEGGLNTATITLYKRAATTPTAPSGTLRYTFENGELTGSLSGWSQSIPATSTEPVWAIGATAISSSAYDDIASEEWTDPAKIAENGTPGSAGYNQATIFLYQRAASKPNKPSTNTTYTFTTGALSSLPTGWQRAIPTANGNPCYVTTAAAISTGSSVVIKANDWSDVTMLAEDGFSPIAKVTKSGNTATISITDAKGTTTQTVKDGISITSVTNYYLASASASGVTPSTSGWTTDPTASAAQMTATKQYLWNYEVTTGSDGNTISTTSPAIIGRYGQNGGAGRGISSITEHYLATSADSGITTSTTGWTTTVQTTTTTNKYLWNYETITYTDSTSNNTTPRIIGTYGDAGEQGFSLRGALIRDRWTDNTWNTTYGEIGNTTAFSNYDIFSSTTGTNGKLPISTWAVGDLFNITGTATDTGIAYTGTWKYTTKRTSDTQTIPCELIALTHANSGTDAQWYYGTDLTHTSGTATLPTTSTSGVMVGAMYLNTKTSLCYKCTAISGTTATWTYAGNIADGVIDNISIGGRNLFRGTATASATNYVFYPEAQGSTLNDGIIRLIPNSSSGAYAKYIVDYLDYDKYKDDYYTLSVDVRLADIESEYTETSVNLYMGVSIASRINQTFAKTKDKYLIGNEVNYTDITSNWRRISLTCKVPDDLTTGVNSALVAGSMITGEFGAYLPNTRPVEFRRPKLERGNKATDWIPAPEDVDADIDKLKPELIVGTHGTTATATWKGTSTKITELVAGTHIQYKLSSAGASNVTLTLTLANGTTTSAIPCYYSNTTRLSTQYGINAVIDLVYDGSAWRVSNPYTNTTYNLGRRQHTTAIKALEAITAGKLICGTGDGYKNCAANVEFSLSYPILYASVAITAGATATTTYEAWNSVTYSTTLAIQSGAANLIIYLKGTVSGNTFTIAPSNALTTVEPTTEDGYYYIPLGVMSSATVGYFNTSNRLFACLNGVFQAVDTAAQVTGQQALEAADAAADDAANAQSTANDAMSMANTAKSTADTAITQISTTASDLATLRTTAMQSLAELQTALGEFQSWINFSSENSLVVGKTTSSTDYVVQIEGDCISFYEAGDVGDTSKRVAYFQNHNLYVDNVIIGNQLDLGNFRFIKQSSGNLSFIYKG